MAIFDLDGTLFDTKDVNYTAYSKALKLCGFDVEIDYRYYCEFCNGQSYKNFLPAIINEITSEEMQRVHEKKQQLYPEFLYMARMNEHLVDMIDLFRSKYIIALATTASKKNATDILNVFDIADKFDLLITQEDVTKTKPDPECFVNAIKSSGVEIKDTIIFEDSETGLQAAKLSGAHYVKVYGYN